MSKAPYVPPKVWKNEAPSGGQFASINRPTAGPTHDKLLPVGKQPLQLYSLATPNGVKVNIMLEELLALGHTGAEYDAWLIRIGEGDQFSSGFVEINPNSKIPALLDRSVEPPVRVFESGSILLYLAEKFGALLPTDHAGRTETLNWLFWQMGSAPYLGGGFGHFYAYAPEKFEYAINRFTMEAKRQLDVLDRRLAESRYLAGDSYTIADIAVWPWYGQLGPRVHACAALGRGNCPAASGHPWPAGQPHLGRRGQPGSRTASGARPGLNPVVGCLTPRGAPASIASRLAPTANTVQQRPFNSEVAISASSPIGLEK
jgi:GST-like protein